MIPSCAMKQELFESENLKDGGKIDFNDVYCIESSTYNSVHVLATAVGAIAKRAN